ncbi:hypothetical protein HELRODRAFT_174858 [Helobdella robusta]|uniref:maleylacetoacetate isomerase n=1 Tax=Helobdella robusta TaxID=6412 RepID=T1F8J7_HELRO|nr:hypothetical protein HELRODRAFT_174858 [Helobdella robusta]ESO01306.1 hypothetical protein HELRODRAFT_174858 [Helobdella robusta]
MPNTPVLYSYFRSSASWRVRIGKYFFLFCSLAYKKIDYAYQSVNLIRNGGEQLKKEFLDINPLGQVPALIIDNNTFTQSLPIIEYLEETRPEYPLLPKDPVKRCQVRQLSEVINSGIQPIQNLAVIKKLAEMTGNPDDKTKWSHFWISRGLEAYEKLVQKTAGKFSVGDDVTLADLCLIPQLYNATRNGVDLSQFPTIQRIADECRQLECFKMADPSNQPDCPADLK